MIQAKLVIVTTLALAPISLAQHASTQSPEDAYSTRDLIAWSQLQTPQPMPQPVPERDSRIPQPQQAPDQQAKPPVDPRKQQEPAISGPEKITAAESVDGSIVSAQSNRSNAVAQDH